MRKFVIHVILTAIFVLLGGIIVLPFVAEMEFNNANKLETDYRWKKAGAAYQKVLHLNPFSGEYFAGAGSFMLRQADVRRGKDKVSWLKRAEKLYGHACQLNPSYAEYRYLLGKAQIEIDRNKLKLIEIC